MTSICKQQCDTLLLPWNQSSGGLHPNRWSTLCVLRECLCVFLLHIEYQNTNCWFGLYCGDKILVKVGVSVRVGVSFDHIVSSQSQCHKNVCVVCRVCRPRPPLPLIHLLCTEGTETGCWKGGRAALTDSPFHTTPLLSGSHRSVSWPSGAHACACLPSCLALLPRPFEVRECF